MPCNIEVMREILNSMNTHEIIRFMDNCGLGWYPFSGDYIDQMKDAENCLIEYLSNETPYLYTVYQYRFQDTNTYYYDPTEDQWF